MQNSPNPADELPLMRPRLNVSRYNDLEIPQSNEITILEYRLDVDGDELPLMRTEPLPNDLDKQQ